jgi:predicted TPR repeat methyltransferase
MMYSTDLAVVHDAAFGELAARAAPAIVRHLHAHGICGGRIVELGCGSGITAAYLAAAGYDVFGIDASAAMVRLARQRAPRASFRVASIAATRVPRCRALVAVGEVITYLPGGSHELRRLFRRVHEALEPGGLLIFDFIESAAGRTYSIRSRSGHDWVIASSAAFDRTRRVLIRKIVVVRRRGRAVRGSSETHHVRIYSRLEIRTALARAGFSVRMGRSYGRYRLLPGDVVAVARRV